MTLNLLLCDPYIETLPKEVPSFVSMFIELFDSVNPNITYRIFDAYNNEFPFHLRPDETYLITGSNISVYEEKAWIKNLQRFIRGAYSMKIPMVGIDFGHLAIAYALEGKIGSAEKGWGAGIRESRIVDPVARKRFASDRLLMHYSHYDRVTRLPKGAVRFATSDLCKNEGFILNHHILTFQGHPEYTDAYLRHYIQNHSTEESKEIKEKALNSISRYKDSTMGQKAAQWILSLAKPAGAKYRLNQKHKSSFF